MTLEQLFSALNGAMPGLVFYGSNVYDSRSNAPPPYLVYQETGRRPALFADDEAQYHTSDVQITLVTKTKDPEAERSVEGAMTRNGLCFSLISESVNPDKSVSRVYETKLEDI